MANVCADSSCLARVPAGIIVSTGGLLEKAERTLLAAKRALEQGDTKTSADRTYFAVIYAAWGLLDAAKLSRPKTHNGLIAELSSIN